MINKEKNHFIDTFIETLKNVNNKEFLVDREIKQIEKFVNEEEPYEDIDMELAFMKESSSIFNLSEMGNPVFFNSIFNQYLLHGEYESILGNELVETEIDEDELIEGDSISEDESIMYIVNEAVLFADYYSWLKEFDLESIKQVISQESQLSLKESILVLHYLGLDFTKYTQTALSEVLSSLLGKSPSNTRTAIGLLLSAKNEKDIKTNDNLNQMLEVFDNKSFTGVKLKIKEDLAKFGVTD